MNNIYRLTPLVPTVAPTAALPLSRLYQPNSSNGFVAMGGGGAKLLPPGFLHNGFGSQPGEHRTVCRCLNYLLPVCSFILVMVTRFLVTVLRYGLFLKVFILGKTINGD